MNNSVYDYKAREYFIKYFSDTSGYKGKVKSYIDYRLEEQKKYQGYVTSCFSCQLKHDVTSRNSRVLDYLHGIISVSLYKKIKNIASLLDSAIVIVFGGFVEDIRIYFSASEAILKNLNMPPAGKRKIHMIGLNLNPKIISKKKIYYYHENNNTIGISFILHMIEYGGKREKYYFRFENGLRYNDFKKEFLAFKDGISFLEEEISDDIYINYLAIDKVTKQKMVYVTGTLDHNISNNHLI